MKKRFFPLLMAATAFTLSGFSAETAGSFGIVNFGTCVSESKLGKQEQSSFDSLKQQMTSLLEETEKQLTDLSAKFNDPEFLDGLSPEAEEEMKNKFRVLNEEMSRYQNQYYQVLNQANMRIVQTLSGGINAASEKISKEKKIGMILNKDACFYYNPDFDITNLVIAEMDKSYEQDAKKHAAPSNAVEGQPANSKSETKK